MRHLVLIGAGGHGRVAADIASLLGYEEIEFLDNKWPEISEIGLWPVVGRPDAARLAQLVQAGTEVFISVGNSNLRQQVSEALTGAQKPCLVHPSAVVSPNAAVDEGTIIVAGAIVNAFAAIGAGVILNTGCTIEGIHFQT